MLVIEVASVASLKPMKGNARLHDQQNIDAIKASLEAHGQVEPLLVRQASSEVIGGSGRLAAMRALGWGECRVCRLDVDATEAAALALRLNRTAELASWDVSALTTILSELSGAGVDVPDVGWPDFDVGSAGEPPSLPAEPHPLGFAEQIRQEAHQSPQGTHTGHATRDGIRYADDGERPAMARPVHLTVEQREIFDRAKAVLIAEADDGVPTSSGRALELICADWLAGH